MRNNKKFANNRIDYIIKLISPSKKDRILNVGISNIPEIEIVLENRVKECTTLDIDLEKLNNASKYLRKTKLIKEDINNKPFKNKKFDKVVILEVLEHLDSDITALKWINSILKKRGHIILSVPNNHPLHIFNPIKYLQHKRHYSNSDILKKLNNLGFKVEHFNLVENWSLLANLYIHSFFKFFLKKTIPFNTFKKSPNKTYTQKNSSGLDIIIKAVKVKDLK